MDAAGDSGQRRLSTFTLLVLVSFLIRLYPAISAVNITPDAVEYLDQARHNARGEFGTVSIKWHYLDPYPVVYNGTSYRPPLFPLAAGAVLALFGTVTAVQVLNALIGSLAVGVWYLSFAPLFLWRVAAGGALAASFSVWFWGTSVIALTESLSMLLAGMICWVVTTGRWHKVAGSAGLGALCALAYLTRHANMILVPLVTALFWLGGSARVGSSRRWTCLARRFLPALVAGTAVLAPFALKNARDFGNPFYDPNWLIVTRGGEESFDHFSKSLPDTLVEYVRLKGALRIIKSTARGIQRTLEHLITGPGGLGLLCLALPLVVFQLWRERQPDGVWFLAGLAVLNLTLYSFVSYHGYNDPRFILLSTFPLYPLCLRAVDKALSPGRKGSAGTGKRRDLRNAAIGLFVSAAVLQGTLALAWIARNIPSCTIARTPSRILPPELFRYGPEQYERLFLEIHRNAVPGETVATGMPWLVNFFTGLPTARLPVDLTQDTLPAFLDRYRVCTVVLDAASLGKERFLRYARIVRALAAEGSGRVMEDGPFVFYQACTEPRPGYGLGRPLPPSSWQRLPTSSPGRCGG